MGPAPIKDAFQEGATRRVADEASSCPSCTNLSSHILTRLRVEAFPVASKAVRGESCPYSTEESVTFRTPDLAAGTKNVTGARRVTLTVSWYSPSPMRIVALPERGLPRDLFQYIFMQSRNYSYSDKTAS